MILTHFHALGKPKPQGFRLPRQIEHPCFHKNISKKYRTVPYPVDPCCTCSSCSEDLSSLSSLHPSTTCCSLHRCSPAAAATLAPHLSPHPPSQKKQAKGTRAHPCRPERHISVPTARASLRLCAMRSAQPALGKKRRNQTIKFFLNGEGRLG